MTIMTSPWKQQPEIVVDKVLKRAEVSKITRLLQNRLALAQFKAKHGWEDLTLDTIEPKVEEERRKKRFIEGEVLSDSSSSTSDLPYPSRGLMSSPMKASGTIFSDAVLSSGGSTGHRKRPYMASFDTSSPNKRFRGSPTAHRSFSTTHVSWKEMHHLANSSPIKPRRQQHFTTSAGPNVSFLASPTFNIHSDDEDDLLPVHSFNAGHLRSSPPHTPPMRTRSLNHQRSRDKLNNSAAAGASGHKSEEGVDLLLYLAASPSPAVPTRTRMEPPSTPPPRNNLVLPSSMMTTPGGSNLLPNTPGQTFDFADYVNITPSPAQKPWKTPVSLSLTRTPLSAARRRLTFDEPLL